MLGMFFPAEAPGCRFSLRSVSHGLLNFFVCLLTATLDTLPNSTLTDEWIQKSWCTFTVEYYAALTA